MHSSCSLVSSPITVRGTPLVCLLIIATIRVSHQPAVGSAGANAGSLNARYMVTGRILTWWDPVDPQQLPAKPTFRQFENIHRDNYSGPQACQQCHPQQHAAWSDHSHRWMNAMANEATVLGDFSDNASISYLGGQARFYREGANYRMALQRGNLQRVYEVTQTIGRRFFQYYVGKLIDGPEPTGHSLYEHDHVLPFGYWLDYEEWVPTVHITEHELPDGHRGDPFAASIVPEEQPKYATACNMCHTTFALGDMMLRLPETIGRYSPASFHLLVPEYMERNHPALWPSGRPPQARSMDEFFAIIDQLDGMEAPAHAVTQGVSCEACHLGLKAHVEDKTKKPNFFASAHGLLYHDTGIEVNHDRTVENMNWICGRCHTGGRPLLAVGASTWNSTEATDALRGSCYSQLTCVNCHNPHQTIGKQWSKTAAEDDASCLKCHQQFTAETALVEHTHHPVSSDGSRCMNCHMPRLNEGLQDVVRTHMIFSPTNAAMIESNEPNACNQCHVEESIDWTLTHLESWYGKQYDEEKVAQAYPLRRLPATIGWLASPREAVRLIAADSLTRQQARWALPKLIGSLDDPYLLNRQFARRGIEQMLGVELEEFGYRFYMTPEERRAPIARIRRALVTPGSSGPTAGPDPP